jgi:hypothetical protein
MELLVSIDPISSVPCETAFPIIYRNPVAIDLRLAVFALSSIVV